jgi:hypothetical protein
VKSDDLLNETDFASFNKKFGPTMNIVQDVLSKFLLIRLSLPDNAGMFYAILLVLIFV